MKKHFIRKRTFISYSFQYSIKLNLDLNALKYLNWNKMKTNLSWKVKKCKDRLTQIYQILNKVQKTLNSIIIIINSYTLVTSIRSTHEKLYAICIEWTKLSEVENHSQSTWLLHAVETVSFKTMYQICSRWSHVRERVF